jgi:flagellar basal body-associated protein FliL
MDHPLDGKAAMAEETPAASATGAPKKSNMKTIIMVVVILVVEGVGIVGAMKMLGGNPAEVSAVDVVHPEEAAEGEEIVEVRVLEAKMPNNKSGVAYLYNTEVYVQVKSKHAEDVEAEVEQFQNEIKSDITAIWRTAEPQYFQEPKLETLTRKVYALLNERFGTDHEKHDPVVSKVVIVMSIGFRIES